MADVKKPSIPTITTELLNSKLDQVTNALRKATAADKSVDVKLLKALAQQTGNATVERAVKTIVQGFLTTDYLVPGDCGTSRVSVEPTKLTTAQVREVMMAMAEAQKRLAEHLGDDQRLSWGEALNVGMGLGLAANIGRAVIEAEIEPALPQLGDWKLQVKRSAYQLVARLKASEQIEHLATHHAETPLGQEAIRWAYRALATSAGQFDVTAADNALAGAEGWWVRLIQLRGEASVGHLSDEKLKRFFDTDDLARFVEQKKAEVQAQVGSYEDNYLKGTDIPGAEHLNDPDLNKVGTHC